MQGYTVGTYPWSIGAVIAILVLLIGVLGLVGVVPFSQTVVFGMLTALAVARLI
jgi:hypothetical protein